jgi:hypothetical protein
MSKFHRTIADNVAAIKAWHDHEHMGEWATCIWEPCSVTEPEFRKVWS